MASRYTLKRTMRGGLLLPALLGMACAAGVMQARAQTGAPVQIAQLPEGGPGGQWKHPESGATSPSGSGAVGPGEQRGEQRDATPPTPPPPPKPDTRKPSDPPPRNPDSVQPPPPPIPAPEVPHKTNMPQ
ncbi:hypothetical protein [Achromobacter aloeverae]